jgi:CTP synthase
MGRPHATSTEFVTPATQPHVRPGVDDVVVFMPEGDRTKMGGTMRLGARTTLVAPGGVAHALYGEGEAGISGGEGIEGVLRVDERHRHRCVRVLGRQAGGLGLDRRTN